MRAMKKTKTSSPLPWFGTDGGNLQTGMLFDHCRHVTICKAGGLQILPKLKAKWVVCNDLHEHAIHFYQVLKGHFSKSEQERLIANCSNTLSHPKELRQAKMVLDNPNCDPYIRAWAYWAMCWIGRKGQGGTDSVGGSTSLRRSPGGGSNASRLVSAAGDLHAWADEFKRCEFECEDFRTNTPKIADREDCGLYDDPPWVAEGKGYVHKFTESDHIENARLLQRFEKTTVVVRYGDDPLIRDLYKESDGWLWIDTTSRTQSNKVRGEVLICKNLPEVVMR